MSVNLQRSHSVAHKFESLPPEYRYQHNTAVTQSPLKRFVGAKKKITSVFNGIVTEIDEACLFLSELFGTDSEKLVDQSQLEEANSYREKVRGITEVLERDHMKVVFFGRTSNGKSTVVNAMLHDKILPVNIGHTTNCFVSVAGSETSDSYLLTPNCPDRKNVQSVGQLAHALCSDKLDESSIVHVYWPKTRCTLLRDDVVLVDSPGIDVTQNLDNWIDRHCLDADVFVLVANAESTLMLTEKSFFHKVSEKLSKPNIFVLYNRWDASASEPELMDAVKQQHLERGTSFLVNELGVMTEQQSLDRVFFISAKEALHSRIQKIQGMPETGGALADGFQARLFEFENFEKKFEECISETAVKTKFEQHSKAGLEVLKKIQDTLAKIHLSATLQRENCIEQQKEKRDRLVYLTEQLNLLTEECKNRIKELTEEVDRKVSGAMTDEIRRLSNLVDEFDRPFHSDSLVIKVYKEELQKHVEDSLGRNLSARCSTELTHSVAEATQQMTRRIKALVSDEVSERISAVMVGVGSGREFDLSYRLDCRHLCADFKEDLEFRFSLGFTTMVNRFLGPKGGQLALASLYSKLPLAGPAASSNSDQQQQPEQAQPSDDLTVAMVSTVASLTSGTSMWLVIVGSVVWRSVGWRVLAVSGGLYGALYCYERLMWTNKSRERSFKQQFVNYAGEKLQLVVNFTSSNCSHQVQQELQMTFANLSHQVDLAKKGLEKEVRELENETERLEEVQTNVKKLRNKFKWLEEEVESFQRSYLFQQQQ